MPWLEMTFARISPPCVTTAAHVSSQLVSIARITARAAAAGPGGARGRARAGGGDVVGRAVQRRRRAPHDEGVLAVVLVVAAAQSGGAEAEALVELDRRPVRLAGLRRG